MFRIIHIVRHVVPDGRLCHVTAEPEIIIFAHRFGHIHPRLVAEMNSVSAEVAEAGIFTLDASRLGEEPCIQAALLMTEALPPGRALGIRIHPQSFGLPPCFEVAVRRGLIDPALLRELNEEVLPAGCGALVPV